MRKGTGDRSRVRAQDGPKGPTLYFSRTTALPPSMHVSLHEPDETSRGGSARAPSGVPYVLGQRPFPLPVSTLCPTPPLVTGDTCGILEPVPKPSVTSLTTVERTPRSRSIRVGPRGSARPLKSRTSRRRRCGTWDVPFEPLVGSKGSATDDGECRRSET